MTTERAYYGAYSPVAGEDGMMIDMQYPPGDPRRYPGRQTPRYVCNCGEEFTDPLVRYVHAKDCPAVGSGGRTRTLEQKLREAEETIRRQAIELDNLREAWAFYEQVEITGETNGHLRDGG